MLLCIDVRSLLSNENPGTKQSYHNGVYLTSHIIIIISVFCVYFVGTT